MAGHRKNERRARWIALLSSFLLLAFAFLLLSSRARSNMAERHHAGQRTNSTRIRKLAETIREGVNARGFYITDWQQNKLVWGASTHRGSRLAHVRAFAKKNNWQVDAREGSGMALFTPEALA